MKHLVAAVALSAVAGNAHAAEAGLRIAQIFLPHHGETARVAIWYPSHGSDHPTIYGDNPVFQGVDAHVDAAIQDGPHPVVLFSHGMGGTDRGHAWLGSALAERGVITVLVNHPNSTWGDFDMAEGVQHWTRAQDLSAAFGALEADPAFAKGIDRDRVMAAGFSYGGWTALSLGGMVGNHAGFVAACQAHTQMEACDVLMSDEVAVQDVDPGLWNASYADPRVTHVAAIDPGFVWGLEAPDVSELLPSTIVVGLGAKADRMLATDFDQSGLAALLGDRRIERFDPAYHFSAMPVCKPAGRAILAEEGDDPVCTDPAGSDRKQIHSAIITLIAEALDR